MTEQKAAVCASCYSRGVVCDAYASWNIDTQEWELDNTFDKGAHCDACEGETRIEWVDLIPAELIQALDPFTRAYFETALWSTTDESDESGGVPLDQNYTISDLHIDAFNAGVEACKQFQASMENTLAEAIATGKVKCGPDFDEMGRAGHDFWLTRNGHGAGFWDGDWPEPYATKLSEAARYMGEVTLYVDEGLIRS